MPEIYEEFENTIRKARLMRYQFLIYYDSMFTLYSLLQLAHPRHLTQSQEEES
jgi:hypothetical protein